MLEILALCSCACITTCIWCAVAVLTCPRIVNVPSNPRSEDPGICQSTCPMKYCVIQNCEETPGAHNQNIYPQSCCPNISYPIIMCPVECPSQNYVNPLTSSSTSVQPSSGLSSTSNLNLQKSTVNKTDKVKMDHSPNYVGAESVSEDSTYSDKDLTVCSKNPPQPPPRLRRNRLKSILKSRFKKREDEDDYFNRVAMSNNRQKPVRKKSDKGSETEFVPRSARCKSTSCRSQPEPVLNSVPLFKMICKTCRLEKQTCKCIGHKILRSGTEFDCPIRFCRVNSEPPKYQRPPNGKLPDNKYQEDNITSTLKTTSLDSSDQTVFQCDQSTCVYSDEDDRRSSVHRKVSKSKTALRRKIF